MYLSQNAKLVANCKMYLSKLHCWLSPSIQVIIVLTQLEGSGGFSIAHRWNSSLKTAAQNNWQTIWETFLGNFFGTDETSSLIIAAQNNLQIDLRLVSWSLIILKHFHQQHQLTSKSRLSANHAISLVFYQNKTSIKTAAVCQKLAQCSASQWSNNSNYIQADSSSGSPAWPARLGTSR